MQMETVAVGKIEKWRCFAKGAEGRLPISQTCRQMRLRGTGETSDIAELPPESLEPPPSFPESSFWGDAELGPGRGRPLAVGPQL